jgi:hypothetical protein
MPPVAADQLPASLLARFKADSPADQLAQLLRLLTPLTVRRPIALNEGR